MNSYIGCSQRNKKKKTGRMKEKETEKCQKDRILIEITENV